MVRIFLSYRRSDVGGHAGRLSDALNTRLGPDNVFHDVMDIAAGRDFMTVIEEALDRCDAAVAVIGPGWLTAATPDGRPRLFQPDDYVRLELATVLRRDLPVAPVRRPPRSCRRSCDHSFAARRWCCRTRPGTGTSTTCCDPCGASRRSMAGVAAGQRWPPPSAWPSCSPPWAS
jgi:hypothetical protein